MKDLNTSAPGVPATGMSMQEQSMPEISTGQIPSFHDTQGTIEVSGNGQLQFTLPIVLPPGVKSVGPQVNLIYTSGSGNGIAGFGWNLTGITSISRMGRNIDKDGENRTIQLDYSDYYMFSGQRLILKSGEYGKDGAEYVTEKYSSTKIRSIGQNPEQNGPAYFEVTFEDGSQALYGSSADTRTVVEYNIVRWQDPQGNHIDYGYIQGDHVATIDRIDWGGNQNAGTAHFNSIGFNYLQRELRETSYVNGIRFVQNNLLSGIEVRCHGNIFKSYELTYGNDDNGNHYQFLDSITEKNAAGEAANPIVFDYKKSNQGEWKKSSFTNDKNTKVLYGDFDGDGKIDVIKYAEAFRDCLHYEDIYHPGNPSDPDDSQAGYWESYCTEPVDYPAGIYHFGGVFEDEKPKQVYIGSMLTREQLEKARVFNLKNDQNELLGRQGLFIYETVPSATSPEPDRRDLVIKGYSLETDAVTKSKQLKEEFVRTVPAELYDRTVIRDDSDPDAYQEWNDTFILDVKEFDIDGDGVSELIFVLRDNSGRREVPDPSGEPVTIRETRYRYLIVQPGEADESLFAQSINIYYPFDNFFDGTALAGDFNGDGCVDFLSFTDLGECSLLTLKKNDQGKFLVSSTYYNGLRIDGLRNKAIVGDFTGDGKTDLLVPQAIDSQQWKLYISTGNGFRVQVLDGFHLYKENLNFTGNTHSRNISRQYFVQDLNKDGKADFLAFYSHLIYDYGDKSVQTKFMILYHENKGIDANGNVIFQQKNIDGSELRSRSSYKMDWYPAEYDVYWTDVQPYASHFVRYGNNENPTFAHFTPLVGDFRINNFNENILVFRESSLVKYSHYSVAEESMISAITQGGLTTEVRYSELEPEINPGFYASEQKEQYPYIELERLSGTFVVSQLVQENRKQDFRYRGFVANVHGKGMIGFRKAARSSWYADGYENTKIWAGNQIDPHNEGLPIKEWTVRTIDDNALIFPDDLSENNNALLTFKQIEYGHYTEDNGVVAIVPERTFSKDFLRDIAEETNIVYEDHYLPAETSTKINSDFSIRTTEVTYVHNEGGIGHDYFIGRPVSKAETITAYGDVKQFREEYFYTGNLLSSLKKYNRDSTGWTQEEYTYDSFGNVISSKGTNSMDAHVQTESAIYDLWGRFVTKKTDNLGLETTIAYNDWGQVLLQTDPFGNTIEESYDAWGKLETSVSSLGGTTDYSYEKLEDYGSKIIETRPDGTPKETYTDKLGQQYMVRTRGFNYEGYIASAGDVDYEVPDAVNTHISIETIYDELGRKTGESEPFYDGAEKKWNLVSYDDSVFPAIATATSFNGKQMKTTVSGNTTIVEELNGNGRITKKQTDPLGNVIRSEDEGGIISFNFNAAGEQLSAIYDENTITTGYDAWGRKSLFEDPANGVYQYEYNGFGQPTKIISPLGYKEFSYNEKGQLVGQKEKSNTQGLTDKDISFVYNNYGLIMGRSGTSNGKLFSSSFVYDPSGRLLEQTENSNGKAFFKKDIQYDANSRVIGYEKGLISNGTETSVEIANSYDLWSGILYKISDIETGRILWKLKENDMMGNVIRASLGSSSVNNTFDEHGMLQHTEQYANGIAVLDSIYTFDTVKNELKERIRTGVLSINENFLYDSNNRLIEWSNPKTNGKSSNIYDIKGRIVGIDNLGTVTFSNGAKVYQPTGIVLNDAGKNEMANDRVQTIRYNENNDPLLIQGQKGDLRFEYGLGAMRQLAAYGGKSDGSSGWEGNFTKYYNEDGSCEVIRDNHAGLEKHIIYIGATPYESNIVYLKDYSADSGSYIFMHKDYLGSILAISDESGILLEQSHFDAWGNLTHGSINILGRGYTSHEHFFQVDIIHMNGRLYDPRMRRFLSPDNHIQDIFNTQNYNRYGYVLNNPLMYNDPSGEFFFAFLAAWGLSALWATVATGAIIGAAVGLAAYTANLAITGNLGMWNLGGALKATFFGAVSGAVASGIGSIFEAGAQTLGSSLLQAGAHGVSQGVLGLVQGQKFISSAVSGLLGSLGAYGWGKLMNNIGLSQFANSPYGIIGFGVLSGGIGSALSGGNFWQGALVGGVVAGLNHVLHKISEPQSQDDGDEYNDPNRNPRQDKKLSDGEIEQLKKAGFEHDQKSVNGKKGGLNDLYKDKKGNVYEKRKGETGFGEPIGYNMNKLIIGIGILGTGTLLLKSLEKSLGTWRFPVFISPVTLYQFENSLNQYQQQTNF